MALEYDNYYYLRGRNLYKKLSFNGKMVISEEAAANLSSDDLKAMIIYFQHINDEVALKSLQNVLAEDLMREPLEQKDASKEYREYYKMANDELGYFLYMNEVENRTCDTCKYLDECPEEYKQEQPNYCENWEQ